jgi:hypothetical protein
MEVTKGPWEIMWSGANVTVSLAAAVDRAAPQVWTMNEADNPDSKTAALWFTLGTDQGEIV